MADEKEEQSSPKPTVSKTSAEEIEETPRKKRRSVEERVSFLEDENSSLREKNDSLSKQLDDICKSLKTKPSESTPGKSLLDDLSDFFNW
jgi:hypothetical protein